MYTYTYTYTHTYIHIYIYIEREREQERERERERERGTCIYIIQVLLGNVFAVCSGWPREDARAQGATPTS